MITRIAWRNIWRNPLRSLVVIGAICFGVAAGTFIIAFAWGSYQQRIQSAIQGEISHVQIHHPEFEENFDPGMRVREPEQVLKITEDHPDVGAYSKRMVFYTMVNSPRNNAPVKVNAVNKADEEATIGLEEKLLEGEVLTGTKGNAIFMGKKLAEKLRVNLKNKVVISFLSKQGEMTSMSFKVTGIFETNNARFDLLNVFVNRRDLAPVLNYSDQDFHEVAVRMAGPELEESLIDRLGKTGNLVESWKDVMPELRLAVESFDQMTGLVMIIIFLAIAFGIINTMLMAVLERVREIGMLMAIGMNRKRLFAMIMSETVMMALVGGISGIVLAIGLVTLFGNIGIDLSYFSEGLSDVGFDTVIYPQIPWTYYLKTAGQVLLVAGVSALYPAWKALKMKPVEAIRAT
jgi:ABC-type lipoprotein release transport system permease subunit